MQLQEIIVDQTLRELTPRGTPLFPIEMYCNDISKFATRSVPWHWHDECELVYVQEGRLTIESNGNKVEVSSGGGAFINSNQLHAMKLADQNPCRMINIVFDTELIAGPPHSIFESRYVLPLIANNMITVVALTSAVVWQRFVLEKINELYQIYSKSCFGYELHIRDDLSQIWLAVFENMGASVDEKRIQRSPHIKNLLTYIHENYRNALSLEEIARSAGIGIRTCNRCFKQQLGMTPFEYLVEYRVKIAAEQLITTAVPITDICYNTGFNDTSYFTKIFRKVTGYTPTAFRKLKQTQDG